LTYLWQKLGYDLPFFEKIFFISPHMSHDLGQAPRIFAENFQFTTDKKIPIMQTNKSQDVMNQEYQEFMLMFEQMRAQGLNPRVCDTPVPYYENKVPCGVSAEVGDTTTDECMMMPRETVQLSVTYMVDAFGESMRDAGIDDGYTLENIIHRWAPPEDGNDTQAYLRTVIRLLDYKVAGRQPLPSPSSKEGHKVFAKIIAAMTCVECGIRPDEVDKWSIEKGWTMAFIR